MLWRDSLLFKKKQIYYKPFSLKLYICTIMARPKEFNYEEKLTIAQNLFWKQGYSATSMSDLETEMKINRSSLYQTYGTKHDLFLKALNQYIHNKSIQYNDASKKGKSPLDAVENIIKSVFQSAIKDTNCLFTNSIYELVLSDKQVAEIIKNQTSSAVKQIEKLLNAAKADGSLITDKSTNSLAHFIISGLSTIYYNQIIFKDKKLTKQTAQILIEIIKK